MKRFLIFILLGLVLAHAQDIEEDFVEEIYE